MLFYDNTMLLLIPAIAITLYAQYKVKSVYTRYMKIYAENGLNGKQVAERLLKIKRLENIKIEIIPGRLTDHYDSKNKKLGLSREVYYGSSIAAQGIVSHEIGHAIQDSLKYLPLVLRSNLVPVSNLGSRMAIPLFLIGFIFTLPALMEIGIIAFSLAVLFQIITIPVEFDASKRAIKLLNIGNMLSNQETIYAKQVLDEAALTYVAATAMAILQLLRLIVLRNRRG